MRHLKTHFGADPTRFPLITAEFEEAGHPNIYNAIQEYLEHHLDGALRELLVDGGEMTKALLGVKRENENID